jgi:hypothetical protein
MVASSTVDETLENNVLFPPLEGYWIGAND